MTDSNGNILIEALLAVDSVTKDYIAKAEHIKTVSLAVRDIYNGFINAGFSEDQAYELAYLQFKSDLELRNKGGLKNE